MKNTQSFYTTNSIADIEAAINDLKAVDNTDLLQSFMDNTSLVFYNIEDKTKKFGICVEDLLNKVRKALKRDLDKELALEVLNEFLNDKKEFKLNARKKDMLMRTKGPKYTKEELEYIFKDVELRDELITQNSKDLNLFQNFKLCGDQMVLVDGDSCELLTEDLQGRITIDNVHWIKPNGIAYRVRKTFMEKIRKYYEVFSNYLSTLDVNDLEMDLDNEIIETPIEDFVQTEIPTSFTTLYKVKAVYESFIGADKKQHKVFKYFTLKRNPKIESFDEIFQYVLENWKKYKSMIYGQEQFKAWSNNVNEVSVSHWVPEEVNKLPEPWKEFLNEKMPDRHFQSRLITFFGMCIDAENTTQQYLIISDQGGTGKGVMMRALEHALPKNSISNIDQGVLSDTNEFGMAGMKIWNSHISVMEEYSDNSLCSDKAKKLIANNIISLNMKGKSHVKWEPINHKLMVFSNKKATIKEYANRRRAIPITFIGQYRWTQEKQDALNNTAKDFLNFCYTIYKKNPLFINNTYRVMSKEDETEFLKNPSAFDNITDDAITKRAFNEEALKEYFNTDEYADTEDYVDFENFFYEFFEESDYEEGTSAKDLKHGIEKKLELNENKDYREAFGYKTTEFKDSGINTRSKEWWKWLQFLNTAHNVKNRRVKRNNMTLVMYNLKFKDWALHCANKEAAEKVEDDPYTPTVKPMMTLKEKSEIFERMEHK